MRIIIRNLFSENNVIDGEYLSLQEAMEMNKVWLRDADLRGLNLKGFNLGNADLQGSDMRGANGPSSFKCADLQEVDMRGSDFSNSDFSFACFFETNLRGTNLTDTELQGARLYYKSLDFFAELIKRKKLEDFTNPEWVMIGQILVHRLCWDSIKKRYGKKIKRVFDVLAKDGFGEFVERLGQV